MLAAVITMPLFFWLYRKDQNLWRKEKRKITWIQWIIVIAAAAGGHLEVAIGQRVHQRARTGGHPEPAVRRGERPPGPGSEPVPRGNAGQP